MVDGSAALALAAGSLAALNPCGFALLPAYLTLLVTGEDEQSTPARMLRAVRMTAAMTAGFAAVFAVFGLVVAPVASGVQAYLPWFSLGVGLLLVLAGGWQLAGRELRLPQLRTRRPAQVRATLPSMFGFGVAYATASLTCTVAPFLAVVVSAFRADDPGAGLLLFVLYAAGMGLVVGTAATAVALARGFVVERGRQVGRWVPVIGAWLLVIVGAYVAYYGWWEIRILRGGDTSDPLIEVALTAQQALANAVAGLGTTGSSLVFLVLLGLGLTPALLHRRRRSGRGRERLWR